jgi:hypothetical protein
MKQVQKENDGFNLENEDDFSVTSKADSIEFIRVAGMIWKFHQMMNICQTYLVKNVSYLVQYIPVTGN